MLCVYQLAKVHAPAPCGPEPQLFKRNVNCLVRQGVAVPDCNRIQQNYLQPHLRGFWGLFLFGFDLLGIYLFFQIPPSPQLLQSVNHVGILEVSAGLDYSKLVLICLLRRKTRHHALPQILHELIYDSLQKHNLCIGDPHTQVRRLLLQLAEVRVVLNHNLAVQGV